MNDKYLNYTGLAYYHGRLENEFASQDDLNTLSDRVDDIVAEGGEPNVIEVVKVNNTALTPDANKAVNIDLSGYAETSDIPTAVSDLTNDGDGTSPFATEDYVSQNGGKIDVIKVNGTAQTITNKEVDITVPTKVSDLTNDSGFQTSNDVSGAITTALANGNDPYVTDSEVDTKISSAVASVYKYKGSVATFADLPASGNTVGDVYDVQETGMNYAWDGTKWDDLGAYVDTSTLWGKSELTAITTAEIDTIVAGS